MSLLLPRKLVVLGDSGVFGWGDPEQGGWCERLRRHWMAIPGAPVLYNLGVIVILVGVFILAVIVILVRVAATAASQCRDGEEDGDNEKAMIHVELQNSNEGMTGSAEPG